VIDWKTEGGRKAVAVAFPVRASGSVVPVRSLDEKLLPVEASSSNGRYSMQLGEGKRKAEHYTQIKTIMELADAICRDRAA